MKLTKHRIKSLCTLLLFAILISGFGQANATNKHVKDNANNTTIAKDLDFKNGNVYTNITAKRTHENTSKQVLIRRDGSEEFEEYTALNIQYQLEELPIVEVKYIGNNWTREELWEVNDKIYGSSNPEENMPRTTHNVSITKVDMANMTFVDNIVDINYLFTNCIGMTTMILPDSEYTSPISIKGLFSECENLVTVENLDKLKTITCLDGTFAFCEKIVEVTFSPTPNPSNIALNMNSMFYKCALLEKVNNFNRFSNIDSLNATFQEAVSLDSITFAASDNPAISAIDLSASFFKCNNLTKVHNFDRFTNITNIRSAFHDAFLLEKISFAATPNPDETPVNISCAFFNCQNLKTIENLDRFPIITDMSSTFFDCNKLESVSFNSTSNNPSNVSVNMGTAFFECNALTEINNLDRFVNISSLNTTFLGCHLIDTIKFAEGNNLCPTPVDLKSSFIRCRVMKDIENLDFFTNVSTTEGAFISCDSLEVIRMGFDPNTMTDPKACHNTFSGNTRTILKYFPTEVSDVPQEWVTQGFTNFVLPLDLTELPETTGYTMGKTLSFYYPNIVAPAYAAYRDVNWHIKENRNDPFELFSGDTKLKRIHDGNYAEFSVFSYHADGVVTSAVTQLSLTNTGKAVRITRVGETEAEEYLLSELPYQLNCESIEKVELLGDEWVDNDIWHLKKQLYGSTWSDVELTGQEDNIKHFDMSGMTFSGDVTSLAWFFNGYPLLEQIDLPVEQIDNEVDLSGTFKSCPNLTTINHLESFTNISEIEQIFNGSSSLTNVTFCANPTQVHPVSLQYAFSGCTDLQSIKNLEQFTNVTHLRSAFENCVSLDTVKLGDSPFDLADVVTDNPYDHPLYYTFEGANPNMLKYLQDTSTVIPQLWDGRNYDNFVLPFTVNDLTTPISFTPGFPFPAPELGDAITPSYAAHHSGHWEMAPADDPTNFTDIDPSIILDADDNGAKVRYVVTCVKDGLEKYSNEATLHYNTNKRVLLTYDDGTQAIYELYGTGSLELLPQDYKDITSVKCLGENWDNGDLWSLREKIYPSNYEDQQNASIETFDMSEMTLSGDISSGFTWMFDDAIALTSLSFPQSGSGTSSVNLNGMFNNATSLRTINNLDKLENISGLKQTFSECAALDTVTFSSTINPNTFELDMTFTFNGCESLKVVNNLERFENISEIKQMFDDCQLLESVTFSPNDNPSDHVLDMSWLFADCIALESVENFDRFTNVASMHGTFINCSSLDKIFLGIDPSTLVGETYAGRDAASSLFGSDQLTFLKYLPEGVTEVHEDIRWFNNYVVPLELSTVYDHDVQLGTAPNLPSYNHVGPWYAATGSTIWQIQKPGEETWETYTPGTPLNDNDYHGAKLRYKTHSYYDEHFNDTDTVYSNEAIITLWQDLIVETNETKTVDETSPVYRNIYVHHNGNLIVNNAIDIDTLILIPNRDQAYNIFTEKAEYARLRAKSMRIEREVDNNYYYFFSFQENVSIANLIASNPHLGTYGTDWLINEYNEALRSQLGKKDPVWKTIQTNETLRANQGYVVGISETFSKFIYRRDFSSSTAIESTDIKEISTTSTAENNLHAVHKGWNLVAIPDYGKAKYKVDYYENNALVYEDVVVDFPINYGYSGYIQLLSSQIDEFCPGQPFFVQCPGYGKLVFAEIKNAATEISLLSVQTSSIQRSIIKISQNGEVSHDYAILDLNENAPKDEYMIMGDVEDMSYLNASPGVYFFDHGHMLMKNAINPSDYTTVPLHVYVPSAGEYTLHLELSEGLALYDKELDTEVLAQDYTFTATARGKIADRFEFIIPQVVTSNDNNQTIDNDIQILIDNGSILISGTESGEQINIYDANGRLLKQITANDENTTISNIPAGVYVINVAGHSEKLIVK